MLLRRCIIAGIPDIVTASLIVTWLSEQISLEALESATSKLRLEGFDATKPDGIWDTETT